MERRKSGDEESDAKEAGPSTIRILFDASKKEMFHGGSGYKKLIRRLKSQKLKVSTNKEDLSAKVLADVDVLVLGGPREKLSEEELADVISFVEKGGSLAALSREGGDEEAGCNLNDLLKTFHMATQPDCVLRTAFYKYTHPKEVFISNGILQPEISAYGREYRKNNPQPAAAKVVSKGTFGSSNMSPGPLDIEGTTRGGGLQFVYPRGSTLTVKRPARAVLSSGAISYPLNRPICCAFEGVKKKKQKKGGRVVVFGSAGIFADDWIDKEENGLLADVVFKWLSRDPEGPSLVSTNHNKVLTERTNDKNDNDNKDRGDKTKKLLLAAGTQEKGGAPAATSSSENDDAAINFELTEETHYAEVLGEDNYERVPDIGALAGRLRCCLDEHEELPRDFMKIFNHDLFGFNFDLIPDVLKLYEAVGVPKEPLTLIPPNFETPLPPLQPATFPPQIKEPPPPPLDQFDLDEHFASSRERLAQLTNKCLPSGNLQTATSNNNNLSRSAEAKSLTSSIEVTSRSGDGSLELDDLEYYVKEAGEIIGANARMAVTTKLAAPASAKHVLAFLLSELVAFKMVAPPDANDAQNDFQFHDDSNHLANQRRLGEEAQPKELSAAVVMAEPTRRRQQLSHLAHTDDTTQEKQPSSDNMNAAFDHNALGGRPVTRSGPSAQPKPAFQGGGDNNSKQEAPWGHANVMTLDDRAGEK